MYFANYESPIGVYKMVSDGQALTGLYHVSDPKGEKIECTDKQELPIFKQVRAWLDAYFAGQNPTIETLPLHLEGTPFQKEVWNALLQVEYGQLATYGDLAKVIASHRGLKRMSSQAVGHALGKNPIPVIVPCHRIVGANGNLTGYTGGLDIKTYLLKLEGVQMDTLHYPKKK
ncbi:hypothetical protein A4S06_06150 [Erysipelotrichaceae bacterium MTC7]|nr:hypothetical protein A4S06_06150 [Erysipelotrichaceae bacterium MTC7]